MLIVGRKTNQKIIISDDIEITILDVGRNRVRFGIRAPKEVRVHTKLQELPGSESPEDPSLQHARAESARGASSKG